MLGKNEVDLDNQEDYQRYLDILQLQQDLRAQRQIHIPKKKINLGLDQKYIQTTRSFQSETKVQNGNSIQNVQIEHDQLDKGLVSPIMSDFSQSPLSVSFGAILSRDITPVNASMNQDNIFQ